MDSDQIALLALVVSILSLAVSLLSFLRDRYDLNATAVPVVVQGRATLRVTVNNSGRRPVSVTHVYLKRPARERQGLLLDFSPQGSVRVDVGESVTCEIPPMPAGTGVAWVSEKELRALRVYVLDAVGKKHRARFLDAAPRVWKGLGAFLDRGQARRSVETDC